MSTQLRSTKCLGCERVGAVPSNVRAAREEDGVAAEDDDLLTLAVGPQLMVLPWERVFKKACLRVGKEGGNAQKIT